MLRPRLHPPCWLSDRAQALTQMTSHPGALPQRSLSRVLRVPGPVLCDELENLGTPKVRVTENSSPCRSHPLRRSVNFLEVPGPPGSESSSYTVHALREAWRQLTKRDSLPLRWQQNSRDKFTTRTFADDRCDS